MMRALLQWLLIMGLTFTGVVTARAELVGFDGHGQPVAIDPGRHSSLRTVAQAVAPSPNGVMASSMQRRAAGETRMQPRAIIGQDERTVAPVDQYPYRAIGRLSIGQGGSCTGSLVHARVVLTNAHCVLGRDRNGHYTTHLWPIRFHPGYHRGSARYGSARAVQMVYSSRFGPRGGTHDYAFLILDRPLGRQVGWLGVRTFAEGWTGERYWYVSGYGSNYSGAPAGTNRLQTINSRACAIRGFRGANLLHDCDTGPGSSGSPIFAWWEDGAYVVGVNWGNNTGGYGDGCHPWNAQRCTNIGTLSNHFMADLRQVLELAERMQ